MPLDQDKLDDEANNSDKAKLSRSHSTSIITDIKKTLQVQAQDHSSADLPSEPGSVVSSLKPDQFKLPPKAKNDTSENKSDDKNKYRRCSSLKSGKTPPGTPGRKIVR